MFKDYSTSLNTPLATSRLAPATPFLEEYQQRSNGNNISSTEREICSSRPSISRFGGRQRRRADRQAIPLSSTLRQEDTSESNDMEAQEKTHLFRPKKVFVSFFNSRIKANQLKKIFSKFGKLRQAYLCKKNRPQKMKNGFVGKSNHQYGFVTYFKYEDAKKVAEMKKVKDSGICF